MKKFLAIKSPAVRLTERKDIFFTADRHSTASTNALNFLKNIKGNDIDPIMAERLIELGFVDVEDNFIKSDDALLAARKNNQLKKEYQNSVGMLMSYMLEGF